MDCNNIFPINLAPNGKIVNTIQICFDVTIMEKDFSVYSSQLTVLLSIFNQIDFYLVQSRKENYHHDRIPFNLRGNENLGLWVRDS